MKKVLILCTGNSCRSIIAEALINDRLKGLVQAFSSGVKATNMVNPLAKKVLIENGIWDDRYYSKTLDKVLNNSFDLVVTVCDNAKENCPVFPQKTKIIHLPFKDPNGKDYKEFIKTFNEIDKKLIKLIQENI